MIESDTIKLLRECDAGIKMGVTSIDEVLDYVHDEELGKTLRKCRDEHNELKGEILTLLGLRILSMGTRWDKVTPVSRISSTISTCFPVSSAA